MVEQADWVFCRSYYELVFSLNGVFLSFDVILPGASHLTGLQLEILPARTDAPFVLQCRDSNPISSAVFVRAICQEFR